jgi:NAD(P)-dependent dehydrogenase (short-subunit alcohol dehydrogenase family)
MTSPTAVTTAGRVDELAAQVLHEAETCGSSRTRASRGRPLGGRICSLSRHHRYTAGTPLGRTGKAEQVAAVVAFLLSEEASLLSGIDVLVDGGVCAAVRGPVRPQ